MNIFDAATVLALKVLKFAAVAAASTMLVTSSYAMWDMYHTEASAYSSADLSQYRPQVEEGEPANLEEVEEINKDVKAWLTIYGTHIDYPVAQGKDDLEYVNKDIYGKTTPTGSIYVTSQNEKSFSDDYNLMYGHHMDNGAMFGDIEHFIEKDYFNSHTKGVLITETQIWDLELFASIETTAQNNIVYFPKRTGLSIVPYANDNAVQKRDAGKIVKVLALSTCDYERTNGRDVAFFKMTPHEGPYEEYITDDITPKGLFGRGSDYWALLNLLCMIVTVYCFFPLHILFSKYRRKKKMKERSKLFEDDDEEDNINNSLKSKFKAWAEENGFRNKKENPNSSEENELLYNTKRFGRRSVIGIVLELLISIIAVVAFILTEDMRLPIRMIDEWTPLMLVLLFACWFVDMRLMRLRLRENDEGEEDDQIPDTQGNAAEIGK